MATPKKVNVGGVSFVRSKNGNLHRLGAVVSKKCVPFCNNLMTPLTREQKNWSCQEEERIVQAIHRDGYPYFLSLSYFRRYWLYRKAAIKPEQMELESRQRQKPLVSGY